MTLSTMEFYIVTPKAATNLILNPSFEKATTNWAASGAGVSIARVTTQQRRGAAACEVTTATGVASGVYCNNTLTAGKTYTFSVDVLDVAAQGFRVYFLIGGNVVAQTAWTGTGHWVRKSVTYTAASSAAHSLVILRDAVASTAKFYVDGAQLEEGATATTYLDGDMAGFVSSRKDYIWNGTPHASTSWRSGDTRSGGTLLRIKDYATIISFFGLGMAIVSNIAHPMTIDRSSFQGTRAQDREFILNLAFIGTHDTMQAARQVLINAVRPDKTTVQQPLIVRYQGLDSTGADASEPIDIYAHYVDGLQNNADNPGSEIAPVRFQSFLPFVAKAGDVGTALGYKTSVTNFAKIGYRDTDGTWKAMGTGVTGGILGVSCMAKAPDGSIYIGGDFTDAGGVADTGYLAKWNGTAFESVVAGLNGRVRAIAIAPDGTIYFGGEFTDAGGVANADYIAKLSGSTVTALGTGMNAGSRVYRIVIGTNGYVYVGGSFTSAGGVANTARIAVWNGSTWAALGTGMNLNVYSLAFGPNGYLYAGGDFTSAGGVSAALIAAWNGSAWIALGSGMGGISAAVHGMAFDEGGLLYAVGEFTTAGGISASNIAAWNGSGWVAIGLGTNADVWNVVAKGNSVYICGTFTAAGGLTLPDRCAQIVDGVYMPIDVNVNDVSATILSILPTDDGRLYIGGGWAGTTASSATVTVTNSSGVRAYPVLVVTGPGTVYQLVNYSTGKPIFFNGLTLIAGESMTLDLRQARFKFQSSWRGELGGYIANGSDLDWFLNGGDNNVSLLMLGDTAASSAFLSWQDLHWSVDGGKY